MSELSWHGAMASVRPQFADGRRRFVAPVDMEPVAALLSIALVVLVAAQTWLTDGALPDTARAAAATSTQRADAHGGDQPAADETLIAGYVGAPFYYRSDVHLQRPGGTDAVFKRLGWDGDALHFPVDGGVRAVRWRNSAGYMVDFLHNKAVARLGKGAHGRKLTNPVIEDVAVEGRLDGKPAPSRIKLTDVFERLEFTHGHNMLFFTPLVRLWPLVPRVRPYFGLGAGLALPHVEVWFPGEAREERTNEYQYTGPAWQLVAGLEFRSGRGSYFAEYKFSQAWIAGALTGDESWKNFNMPGDVLRQVMRWWSGAEPKHGRFSTTLAAHQIVAGGGYWLQRGAAVAP